MSFEAEKASDVPNWNLSVSTPASVEIQINHPTHLLTRKGKYCKARMLSMQVCQLRLHKGVHAGAFGARKIAQPATSRASDWSARDRLHCMSWSRLGIVTTNIAFRGLTDLWRSRGLS